MVLSERGDWNEDVWTYNRVDEILEFHGNPDYKIFIAGDSEHIQAIVNNKSFVGNHYQATILDIETDTEPYELL